MNRDVYHRLLACSAPAKLARLMASRPHYEEPTRGMIERALDQYRNGNDYIVVFSHPKPCGKTLAALAFITGDVKCANPHSPTSKWAENERPLFLNFLDHHNFEYTSFNEWAAPPVLVLDDLGAGMGESKMHLDLIFGLLQKRTLQGLTTIITTRLDESGLRARYGRRVAELIEEFGIVLTPADL